MTGRAPPSRAEPGRAEPSRAEPSRAALGGAGPGRPEASRAGPSHAAAAGASPGAAAARAVGARGLQAALHRDEPPHPGEAGGQRGTGRRQEALCGHAGEAAERG